MDEVIEIIKERKELRYMNADEMFEKLEFVKKENKQKIIYYIDIPIWKPSIAFLKKYKSIRCDLSFSMQELQAINKKVKELRVVR